PAREIAGPHESADTGRGARSRHARLTAARVPCPRMSSRLPTLALGALLLAVGAGAQTPVPPNDGAPIDEIVITGEYPGPGLWKVTRDGEPAGHTLWIIGDPPPLPKRLAWKSSAVEAVVLRSQEILRDTGVTMQP